MIRFYINLIFSIILFAVIIVLSFKYNAQKKKLKDLITQHDDVITQKSLLWLASGEALNDILKDKRIDVVIDENLKNVKNKEDLIAIYNKNAPSFKNKMKNLEKISIQKRKVGILETEWQLVFFSVLLNQSYEYGATSAYLDLRPEMITKSLPHIKSLHCGNLITVVDSIMKNIAGDFSLTSLIFPGHGVFLYGEGDEVLLLDPTFNIYGFFSKKGLNISPLERINKISDFVFLENKNNTNTGHTWHDDMNKFQASVLYYIGGNNASISKLDNNNKPLESHQEVNSPYLDIPYYKIYNDEYRRKINY